MDIEKQNEFDIPLVPEYLIQSTITHNSKAIYNRLKLTKLIIIAFKIEYKFRYFHIHFNEFCNYFYIWNPEYKFAFTFDINEDFPRIWFNCPKCLDECFMQFEIDSTIEEIEKEIEIELKKHKKHCRKYHDLNKGEIK